MSEDPVQNEVTWNVVTYLFRLVTGVGKNSGQWWIKFIFERFRQTETSKKRGIAFGKFTWKTRQRKMLYTPPKEAWMVHRDHRNELMFTSSLRFSEQLR